MPAPAPPTTPGGAELRAIRSEKKLTQDQLAEKAGISQAVVSRVETGADPLTSKVAHRIETKLGLERGRLLDLVDMGGWFTMGLQAA